MQKAQLKYGVYACVPGTQHTYEEVIQSLVGLDLRRQYEERRHRNHTYEPKRHITIKVKRRNQRRLLMKQENELYNGTSGPTTMVLKKTIVQKREGRNA
ncbi:hypothetical protein KSC_058250 [Ktedonobacter sp. SOSP1-52]|uniref:hypothetical protein n=1 Tax=Ktedonobacter sp. SOSP1-52 TaxID=2778366 RepID=UPI001915BF4A|nr:hypothetical protein [Ktedonobacter sp. SOSP1-52]GHO66933.1 hypothetical protein KSC_058250 [Ktedonobacter sp. SOSP1-52]